MESIRLKMIANSESRKDKEAYWQTELRSLGLGPKRRSELNDNKELEALSDNLKQNMYQEYKTATDNSD